MDELKIVSPDGWLHVVPRSVFPEWCKEQSIERPDNLSRACKNFAKGGWHFSNAPEDGTGAWQPLHKLVFLQKVARQLKPIASRALEPVTNEPTPFCTHKQKDPESDMAKLKGPSLAQYLSGSLKTGKAPTKRDSARLCTTSTGARSSCLTPRQRNISRRIRCRQS